MSSKKWMRLPRKSNLPEWFGHGTSRDLRYPAIGTKLKMLLEAGGREKVLTVLAQREGFVCFPLGFKEATSPTTIAKAGYRKMFGPEEEIPIEMAWVDGWDLLGLGRAKLDEREVVVSGRDPARPFYSPFQSEMPRSELEWDFSFGLRESFPVSQRFVCGPYLRCVKNGLEAIIQASGDIDAPRFHWIVYSDTGDGITESRNGHLSFALRVCESVLLKKSKTYLGWKKRKVVAPADIPDSGVCDGSPVELGAPSRVDETVREEEGVTGLSPEVPGELERFKNLGDTVLDTRTGLEWEKDIFPRTVTWDEAMKYAEILLLGGHADWRLPTIEELLTLVAFSQKDPASMFPGMPARIFWSSSSYSGSSSSAWSTGFYYGNVYGYGKTSYFAVRCARRGPLEFKG